MPFSQIIPPSPSPTESPGNRFQLVLHQAQHFACCTLHISYISRVTIYSFDVLLSQLEQVCFSMSGSNCCFLTCIQISQETGKVVWYLHLFKNFPQFVVNHTVKGFGVVNIAEIYVFLELSCFLNDSMDLGNLNSSKTLMHTELLRVQNK